MLYILTNIGDYWSFKRQPLQRVFCGVFYFMLVKTYFSEKGSIGVTRLSHACSWYNVSQFVYVCSICKWCNGMQLDIGQTTKYECEKKASFCSYKKLNASEILHFLKKCFQIRYVQDICKRLETKKILEQFCPQIAPKVFLSYLPSFVANPFFEWLMQKRGYRIPIDRPILTSS